MDDLISRQEAIEALQEHRNLFCDNTPETFSKLSYAEKSRVDELDMAIATLINLPSAQPDTEKICARIKAEAIKRNVEYMKHGDRYMLGFVDGMRLARRIVDGTIDDPVYFTLSGE